MCGLTATGDTPEDVMSGYQACGGGLHMKALTGRIHIGTTIPMAGVCMKAIGTVRTTATTTTGTIRMQVL